MSTRVDKALVERGLTSTRSQSQVLIDRAVVYCNSKIVTKSSYKIREEDILEVRDEVYVSRGAYKLIEALKQFDVSVEGKTIADVGASTGGFTQVLLKNNAKKVYCIDVGHDQLNEIIKSDSRVINMEGAHINDVSLPETVDLCVVDLSFISILNVIDKIMSLLNEGGVALILIKPQFEAGKEMMGKNAVLKEEQSQSVFIKVCNKIESKGFKIRSKVNSPITGKQGNKEFLIEVCSVS